MTYWQMIHADRQHPSDALFLAKVFLEGLWVCVGGPTSSGGSSREKLGAGRIVGIPQHPLLPWAELVLHPRALGKERSSGFSSCL